MTTRTNRTKFEFLINAPYSMLQISVNESYVVIRMSLSTNQITLAYLYAISICLNNNLYDKIIE